MRGSLLLLAVTGFGLLLVAPVQAGQVLEQEPFAGDITSPGSSDDPIQPDVTVADAGSFSAPRAAQTVRVTVAWTEPGLDHPLKLTLEEDGCEGVCNSEVIVSEVDRPPVAVHVPVPDDGTLGWSLDVENETVVDEPFEGEATYFAPEDEAADPGSDPSRAGSPTPTSREGATLWRLGGGLALLGGLAVAARRVRTFPRRWVAAPIAGLFHRLGRDELLDNPTRARIRQAVADEPGTHFAALARRLELGHGALEHHLARMEDAALLVEHRQDGYRGYFLPGEHSDEAKRAFMSARASGARALLQTLASDPGASLTSLAEATGLSISTASYHAERLEDRGLIARRRANGSAALSLTPLGERIAAALDPP